MRSLVCGWYADDWRMRYVSHVTINHLDTHSSNRLWCHSMKNVVWLSGLKTYTDSAKSSIGCTGTLGTTCRPKNWSRTCARKTRLLPQSEKCTWKSWCRAIHRSLAHGFCGPSPTHRPGESLGDVTFLSCTNVILFLYYYFSQQRRQKTG